MLSTVYIVSILVAIILAISIIAPILKTVERSERIGDSKINTAQSIYGALDNLPRKNCGNEEVYCFEDLDCYNLCNSNERNVCRNGICRNRTVISTAPHHDCEAKEGKFALFRGNPALGTYEWTCESIDPGVAVPNEKNRMCLNGTIDIDYFRSFPAITDCQCPGNTKAVIGATSSVRRLVQCSSQYADLLRLVLPDNAYLE